MPYSLPSKSKTDKPNTPIKIADLLLNDTEFSKVNKNVKIEDVFLIKKINNTLLSY